MGKITVTLHRWAQDMPDLELDVEREAGGAPELVHHRGAVYERIPGTLPPTYSFLRFEKQTQQ